MTFNQAEFQIRCEWGCPGMRALGPISDVVVIVDVLSFTTALDVAVSRGGIVAPYPLKGESAARYAATCDASLAGTDRGTGFSLSPTSLLSLPCGYRLVLPSPNGSALAFSANHPVVLAACLRNASAVGSTAARVGSSVAVIPAGEIWPSGELRPSLEDLIGAGAVIASLPESRSPEADISAALYRSGFGKELIARGFASDVDLASELNVSSAVPQLAGRAFIGESAIPYIR